MQFFHVAANGDDSNPGTEQRPFASLSRAQAAARALPPGTGTTIVVHPGTYCEVALVLGPEDSGLTIAAAPGPAPFLCGGRRITGWRPDGDGFFAADLPQARTGAWDFRLLTVNGRLCPRARFPATGTLEHLNTFEVPWMSTTGGGWQRKPTEAELTHLTYREGDLGPWLDLHNAELTVYHQWDESVVGLRDHDEATRTLTFSTPAGHPPGAFGAWNAHARTYVVWNVREGMTEPGQWYLDRAAGKVVYWPLPGEDMTRAEALAPVTESVIAIAGTEAEPVRDVRICGLRIGVTGTPLVAGGFAASKFAGAVAVRHARDCVLSRLEVFHAGGQAIKIQKSAGVRVERCELREIGAGGIYSHATENVTLANNHLHGLGRAYPSAQGMNLSGNGFVIRHNEIHDVPYSAIGLSGNDADVEANLLYDFMRALHDGAAIYITFCRNIALRGNVARGASGTLAHGYYMDEQADNCIAEGNLAVNTRWPTHNHMAHNCVYRHNVFVDEADARMTFMKCQGFTFAGNVVCTQGALLISTPEGGVTALPRNLLFSGTGKIEWDILGPDGYGSVRREPFIPRDGTVVAEPLFRNAAQGDYGWAPDSPAVWLGLPELNVAGAGIEPDAEVQGSAEDGGEFGRCGQ